MSFCQCDCFHFLLFLFACAWEIACWAFYLCLVVKKTRCQIVKFHLKVWVSWSIWKPDEFSGVTGGLQLVESQEKACFDVECMRPRKLPPCLPLISFLCFCLAFACLFLHLWCYFSSNEFLPLNWFFSLALFEFESLLVLKIPFSVRLGFLLHLKFLISEYLSHFCSDSLFCNGMSVKKEPNSCLFFFFFML